MIDRELNRLTRIISVITAMIFSVVIYVGRVIFDWSVFTIGMICFVILVISGQIILLIYMKDGKKNG
ncbi:MAG: hypothetical protein U9R75_06265 [Candidatus Thermoplasmatota archaeon]|nr:hypothetical protein [Candidatus Thermoplasmatota archaeon]